MNDIFHKPIEKRKLLLLCNPGREEDRNYTPAVFNVLNRYKEYFMSPVGGGWISSDVEEHNEIIEEPAGYDDEGEQTWLYDQIRKICRHTDYSIIVFVGHGDSTHGDEIQLSKGKFIPVNSFLAQDYFGNPIKRTVIVDACRTLAGRNQERIILEQRTCSGDNMLETGPCRDLYNKQIQDCEPHFELIQSTRYGEPAYVNPEGTGTAFSDALFGLLDVKVPQWNAMAMGVRTGQKTVTLNSLMTDIAQRMQVYHQVPQYSRTGEGDFPIYSVWRPVERSLQFD